MRRGFHAFWRLILYPTRVHIACAALAFCCCFPILFPEISPEGKTEEVISYAGAGLLMAQSISTAFVVLAVVVHMFRLSNTRAFTQLFKFLAVWIAAAGCYVLLAIAADVPAPEDVDNTLPIQTNDTQHPARDQLSGPASLVIDITPEGQPVDTVVNTPNLTALEEQHEELFKSYLDKSPRWTNEDGDYTFYSKPGHLVMVPPTTSGAPGLVHVCFCRLVEGDPLPQGYEIVKPGGPMPEMPAGSTQMPDLALDLGRNHFLLLAWRGSSHRETACKALNAAIATTDALMQPLRESPTPDTVQRMLNGQDSYPGNTPELRLSEPLAQEGAYQGEIYANPGEPGVILVYIKELPSHRTLRLLSCPARYSQNADELFRHDLPGSVPQWVHHSSGDNLAGIFPASTPLFVIRTGQQHQYFGVAFEVWFKPSDVRRKRHMLLRRCYKVQAYDPPVTETKAND